LLEESFESKRFNARTVDDGKVFGSKSECPDSYSVLRRNMMRMVNAHLDCFTNGRLSSWLGRFCHVWDRGGLKRYWCKTLHLIILLLIVWEQANLWRSWRLDDPVGTGDVRCGSLWSALMAGKPAGNDSSSKNGWA
jgi:hypothetical protein